MTGITPPAPGDPAEIGPYRILGRLGRGGQGTVYLAESPSGTRVAVKVLNQGDTGGQTLADFNREIELARRVKAFCTAQVLENGEIDGRPYIFSEYVDGPSLAQVIEERGPLRGAELRRLAIGTLTALAAIHQAGVIHRDFKPANVLLAREGPRVIDFGISRALDSTSTAFDHLVGTPPYMAPEQFEQLEAGPAADLFAWASTVVCAATGEPPFGNDSLPVVIHRILNGEPRLGDLDEELRELVEECLSKDPRARPAATAALLRLLGHPVAPQRLLDEGREQAVTPPPGKRRPAPLAIAGSIALALALVVGLAIYLTRTTESGETSTGLVARPSVPATTAVPERPRIGPMPTTSTTDLKIPGTKITLHENPSDAEGVTSYEDRRRGSETYLRQDGSAKFRFLGTLMTAIAAPGGERVVVNPTNKFLNGEFDLVRVLDAAGAPEVQIRTVDSPMVTFHPHWDVTGTRVLLTVFEGLTGDSHSRGFAIVDVASRTARIALVPDETDPSEYVWGPDSASVMHTRPDGAVRFHRLDGSVLRTVPGVGELTADDVRSTSLGTVFTTRCPDKSRDVCLWDAETAKRRATVPIGEGMGYGGWLGDRHLLTTTTEGRTREVVMLDLRGKIARVLADGPVAELDKISLWYTPR
ncbi:Serine/threonine protein kinase [Streptosporangium subroseum]|uniref:Serine/threonine protein kinase n=1 Tax=Streptosporangium subroseum TaxID=106412 RepID=A0A239EPQ9_9ACTN|nr:protein kinase [Streptosporangium subroseum]SNS46627.1 Serine/threonine protein kinase [Streptosporangium subroseum]